MSSSRPPLVQVWYTHWAYYPGDKSVEFAKQTPITVGADGTFSLPIAVDSITTISTVTTANKVGSQSVMRSGLLY